MKKPTKILAGILIALLVFGALAGCVEEDSNDAREADQQAAGEQLERLQAAQPVPEYDWSQLRQNLIELQTSQAQTTQTTSFFFNQGTDAPIGQCPSIGFPIASTMQLTNPEQVTGGGEGGRVTLPQVEQTGVFTGDSTGTYVMCLDGSGNAYAFYWEGFVSTVTGAAEFTDGQVRLVGEPTFDFSTSEEQ